MGLSIREHYVFDWNARRRDGCGRSRFEEGSIGTLIRGGTVVTATDVMQADVSMEEGWIAALGNALDASGHATVDAENCYIFSGGIDRHTHLDIPFGGTTTADDFATGRVAAALGGTTSVVDYDYERPDFASANYVMSPPLRPKWNQNVLLRKLKN